MCIKIIEVLCTLPVLTEERKQLQPSINWNSPEQSQLFENKCHNVLDQKSHILVVRQVEPEHLVKEALSFIITPELII